MNCELCKDFITTKKFVSYYDFRGNKYIYSLIDSIRFDYLKIKFAYQWDMIICSDCFIYKHINFDGRDINMPDYIPIQQCKRWLKRYLLK